jgi:hypothetical protein
MKVSQSVLPRATRKECVENKIASIIRRKIAETFKNGFWYCLGCESRCERIEGENGQPSHCDQCGSYRIRWNAPAWTDSVPVQDTKLIHPGEL